MQDPLAHDPDHPDFGLPPREYPASGFTTHDHTSHDYIGIPEPPDPQADPKPEARQPAPSFPHRPARSMATAMLAAGLVIGSIGGGTGGAPIAKHRTVATQSTAGTVSAGIAAPAPSPG